MHSALTQAQLRQQLEEAIKQLDGPNQQLLFDRFFGQMPLRAIAAQEHTHVSGVSRRIARAVTQLATALREMGCQAPADLLYDPALQTPAAEGEALRFAADWNALGAAAPVAPAALAPGWRRPIRVGVFVGYATSRVVSRLGYMLGIEAQTQMTTLLVDPAFELVSIVEPDTSQLGPVERTIREYELTAGLVDGTDYRALKTLDVILLGPNFGMVDAVLRTIFDAVSSGVGLLNEWWVNFDHNTLIDDSLCVRCMLARPPAMLWHSEHWHDQPMPATVVRTHPAVPGLCVGQRLTFNSCGPAYFPVDDAQMVAVKDHRVPPREHGQTNVGDLPLPGIVAGHIGRGRVLVTNFAMMKYIRDDTAIRHRLVPEALHWLAAPRRDA